MVMYCCRLWSLFCHPPTPPYTHTPPPALLRLPPPPNSLPHSCPYSSTVTVARQLPPYLASVLGNWPVARRRAIARSSQLRRLLPPRVSLQTTPPFQTHTRLSLTRTNPPPSPASSSSSLPSLGNTFRHPCLLGISLARAGWLGPAALMLSGKA